MPRQTQVLKKLKWNLTPSPKGSASGRESFSNELQQVGRKQILGRNHQAQQGDRVLQFPGLIVTATSVFLQTETHMVPLHLYQELMR